jgi:hypothetical protein
MATKTWKIGEYCKGGIITVQTKGNKVAIIGKEWDMSQGTRRSSNQKNAKEWTRLEIESTNRNAYREAFNFLHDLTTSYYADQVLDWIKEKVDDNNFFNFY